MANVIEILIRAKNDASRVLNDVERQAANVSDGFGGMATRVRALAAPTLLFAGALAGAGVAAFKLAKDLASTVEKLDQVSARTGLSIESVQVYQQILEEAGASVSGLTTGLTFLSRAIATDDPVLKKLGITTKDTGEAFKQLITIIASATDETLRNEVAFRLLGRGSGELVANAKDLADGFDDMRKSLDDSGKLITEKTAPAIRELDTEMDRMSRNWGGMWRGMQQATVPAATAIIAAINDIVEAASGRGKGRAGSPARFGMFGAFAGAGAGVIGMPGVPVAPPGASTTNNANTLLANALAKNADSTKELTAMLREANSISLGAGDLRREGFPAPGPMAKVGAAARIDPRHQVLGDWKSTIEEITSSATVLDETLNSLFIGLQSGFTQAFQGLLSGAMSFAGAMKSLFSSLVNEILAQLARIAAAKVFGFILNLIGVPGGGGIGGGGGGNPIGQTGGAGIGDFGARQVGPQVNIYAIDERSFAEHFRSMGGSVRVTDRRLAESAEW